MKFHVIRFGCALSAVWGLIILLTGLANLIWPAYAVEFLKLLDSVYPGYHFGQGGICGVLVATLYGLLDGWLAGIVFAWLYNLLTRKKT